MSHCLTLCAVILMACVCAGEVRAQTIEAQQTAELKSDPRAERLIKEAMSKLAAMRSLEVEASYTPNSPRAPFKRGFGVKLLRPNFIRVEEIRGKVSNLGTVVYAADGTNVWTSDRIDYIGRKQPQRRENFFLAPLPLPQYFFTGQITFDPADGLWGIPVSLFATNKAAYDKHVVMRSMGEGELWGEKMQIVEIRFNTRGMDVSQKIYLKDGLIYQVSARGMGNNAMTWGYQFKNYKINTQLTPTQFIYQPPEKQPVQDADPVRLGHLAPDFELPLNNGGTIKLRELLKQKKGVLIVALEGARGRGLEGPDVYLRQMQIMQQLRDKFGAQGLEVVAVVGGNEITQEVKDEMLRNWLPDQTRFSYPVALDLDIERGIQGSAYYNFQLRGRNNILLDKTGRVVFACNDFDRDPANELALYQALAQIGFNVAAVDLQAAEGRQ